MAARREWDNEKFRVELHRSRLVAGELCERLISRAGMGLSHLVVGKTTVYAKWMVKGKPGAARELWPMLADIMGCRTTAFTKRGRRRVKATK